MLKSHISGEKEVIKKTKKLPLYIVCFCKNPIHVFENRFLKKKKKKEKKRIVV
jgi:hypothetical protein